MPSHEFKFGGSKHRRYSDNALNAMKRAAKDVDLAKVYAAHRTPAYNQRTPLPACDQPGCVLAQSA